MLVRVVLGPDPRFACTATSITAPLGEVRARWRAVVRGSSPPLRSSRPGQRSGSPGSPALRPADSASALSVGHHDGFRCPRLDDAASPAATGLGHLVGVVGAWIPVAYCRGTGGSRPSAGPGSARPAWARETPGWRGNQENRSGVRRRALSSPACRSASKLSLRPASIRNTPGDVRHAWCRRIDPLLVVPGRGPLQSIRLSGLPPFGAENPQFRSRIRDLTVPQ